MGKRALGPRRRTLLAMVTATVFFLLAAILGHAGYVDDAVTGAALVLTLVGFGLRTLGGWLGGSIVSSTACGC